MLIQWTTKSSTAPEVRWGLSSGNYSESAAGSSITYGREDMCGGPATAEGWMDPGLLHQAVMTDLLPGQRYYYMYGDEVSCVTVRPVWRWNSDMLHSDYSNMLHSDYSEMLHQAVRPCLWAARLSYMWR